MDPLGSTVSSKVAFVVRKLYTSSYILEQSSRHKEKLVYKGELRHCRGFLEVGRLLYGSLLLSTYETYILLCLIIYNTLFFHLTD